MQKIGEKLYSAAKEKEEAAKSAPDATPEDGQGSDEKTEESSSTDNADEKNQESKDEDKKENK